jgi:phosphoribosylaminoimidazolecarboxamide formyltransferase/IMP cyclohydrolase
MPDLVRVRTALLSVSDKTGLVEFATALAEMGVRLISTGGTARALRQAGLEVTPVEELTGFPEMMDGRVKTLHPMVHGGILAVRDNPEHAAALARHGITPIDLVCINLYPFAQTVARPDCTRGEAIEQIDIGGPSMVRSAAKNHADVVVVTSPSQYPALIEELRAGHGCTHERTRRRLAREAFARTAEYDAAIARYLAATDPDAPARGPDGPRAPGEDPLPERLEARFVRMQPLRYGENPHQRAAVYREGVDEGPAAPGVPGVLGASQRHGKELSYNNLADASAAWELATAMQRAGAAGGEAPGVAAVVIKHANPCGAALAGTPLDAVDLAIAGDPVAAYGGILACTGRLDAPAAERLARAGTYLEVVVAGSFDPEALEVLRARSGSIRLLEIGDPTPPDAERASFTSRFTVRSLPGGLLVQERDLLTPSPARWRRAAGPEPTPERLRAAGVLEAIVAAMSSNAVGLGGAITTQRGAAAVRLYGGGLGQVDRVTACRLAVLKAGDLARGAIAVSDAFFPFDDGPRLLIEAGVTMIVHPGGSKRDQDTINLCDRHGVTCMLTGVRRFRH